jgi:hypothetical protein
MAGIFHMTGHNVNDTSFAFDNTFELQQLALQQYRSKALHDRGPNHYIGIAGFVFQRKKDYATGRARSLPAGDYAGDTDHLTCAALF